MRYARVHAEDGPGQEMPRLVHQDALVRLGDVITGRATVTLRSRG